MEVVKYLLRTPQVNSSACVAEGGANTDTERLVGKTGLHLAAIHDCPKIAEALIAEDLEIKCPLDTQDEKVVELC